MCVAGLGERYVYARNFVVNNGYEFELEWQASIRLPELTEQELLREIAWVILNSGFRESIVRRLFPDISDAYFGFRSARVIARNSEHCQRRASATFKYARKLQAISNCARFVDDMGFPEFVNAVEMHGVGFLQKLDFIGPITAYHIAKNIGVDVAKPDRHVSRLARALGFPGAEELCQSISSMCNDTVAVVDTVLWRFATLNQNYVKLFQDPEAPALRYPKQELLDC